MKKGPINKHKSFIRSDGRNASELRPINFEIGFIKYPEGSVLISMGNTRVLCNVSVLDEVPPWMRAQSKPGGWVTAEYSMLPRSTHTRSQRETRGASGRTQEIQRLVGRALRTSVHLDKLGARTLIVDCDVLQADGGTRTASITGGYVALRLALNKLIKERKVSSAALGPAVAAISAGVVQSHCLLDLCYVEDSKAEADMNVVMNEKGEFIEIQATAEGAPFSEKSFTKLMELSRQAISSLLKLQQKTLL